ncbi:MAG TPA: LuxR C-terminal-related transcriptional regulator [Candidatus Binatia bacterium]|nr:LuxR C-terminal-related transcriptional regulator [Candidatus Binatia bacterium]
MKRTATLQKPALVDQAIDPGRASRLRQSPKPTGELTVPTSGPVDPFQLVESAKASLLIGQEREGLEMLARAHQSFLRLGETRAAARCAFWLGFVALLSSDLAQASGWLSRAERLLASDSECVEKGYLFLPVGYRFVHENEPVSAYKAFVEAGNFGRRFRDPDLVALALQGQGRSLIRQGEIVRGVTLLDEAMVAVTAGEVSPLTAGGVYCSVLDACGEIFDLRRAQEWTSALERWCALQPDIVPYRGQCMVRRAEILQLHGAWDDAMAQAREACERFSRPARLEAGSAFYRLAELHRMRGEFEQAEKAYREAGRWQRIPHPGMALLRLAQGHVEVANSSIRRIADEVCDLGHRTRVLDSYVEIVLATKDVAAARAAAEELQRLAQRFNAPLVHAMSARATGEVLLAEHDAKGALAELRRSWNLWCELDAPYDAARTRVLMASACKELDDCDAAKLELELAREVFQRLGAGPDLARLEALLRKNAGSTQSILTAREVQVVRLIASGKTNRAIAVKLGISEKTVARHISNIFNKLGISSRSAATAFAYQHELV